jgi:hypothetical protein
MRRRQDIDERRETGELVSRPICCTWRFSSRNAGERRRGFAARADARAGEITHGTKTLATLFAQATAMFSSFTCDIPQGDVL